MQFSLDLNPKAKDNINHYKYHENFPNLKIQIAWITHNSFKNNGGNMWQEILTFGKFLLY